MSVPTAPHPQTPLRPLGAAEARWVSGFWGEIADRTRAVTVPAMWDSLRDPAISPALRNFRIAAGLGEGTHVGPPFMDGDLYKWLEAAIAELEVAPDPVLSDIVPSSVADFFTSRVHQLHHVRGPAVAFERVRLRAARGAAACGGERDRVLVQG